MKSAMTAEDTERTPFIRIVLVCAVWILGLILSFTFQPFYGEMHSKSSAYFFAESWRVAPLLPIGIALGLSFAFLLRRCNAFLVVLLVLGALYLISCFFPLVITVGAVPN